ncbi:unnamed protein product [Auanema sp. JU1783]|nr:unnamed protein product [Auanema sp. JU1783]
MTDVKNPPAKEDSWAFQPIGSPFPPNPVKCLGQQNMYVALWYKHGKPIHGRAWNNGGVVECSFPYNKTELKTKEQLEGQIQILQYEGDHNTQGYWYEWVLYKNRFEKEGRGLLKCGDSSPILWKDRKEGVVLGYLDNKTEVAYFSWEGKVIQKQGGELNDMVIIMRNYIGGPPFCDCAKCPKVKAGPPPPRTMLDEWMDLRVGDPWPQKQLVQALNKKLDTIPGENPEQFVALWYMAGEPVMGRVWNENGCVAACFAWMNKEYRQNVGSIQILINLPDHVRGFDYEWIKFKEASVFTEKVWHPVHVNNVKGDISPAVLSFNGKQILGKCDVRNEKASAGFEGAENVQLGGNVAQTVVVLCRKAKPGYKFE